VKHPTVADPEALLTELLADQVEFIVVGGTAAVLHAAPVATQDLDIVHRRTEENVARLMNVLVRLDAIMRKAGLDKDAIVVRMTGCPNGCARPYLAEIGLVGKNLGKYNLYLGGGFAGDRLNKLYRENLADEEIVAALEPILHRYARERNPSERFGDFVIRAGYVKATTQGLYFHD